MLYKMDRVGFGPTTFAGLLLTQCECVIQTRLDDRSVLPPYGGLFDSLGSEADAAVRRPHGSFRTVRIWSLSARYNLRVCREPAPRVPAPPPRIMRLEDRNACLMWTWGRTTREQQNATFWPPGCGS